MSQRLAVCAKSTWTPSIRREHAFVRQALDNFIDTTFIEAASDIRDARASGVSQWVSRLAGHPDPASIFPTVIQRSTLIPGHRHRLAANADTRLLRRIVRDEGPFSSIVVNVPWQWKATAGAASKRVFDAADDWTALIPQRRAQLELQYRKIAAEADAIIVANPALGDLFPGRATHLVPNAAESSDIAAEPVPPPGMKKLAYVGTLSERFDAELVDGVLASLPDWSLDLYGQCRYAGSGERPGPALEALLKAYPTRLRWWGVVERSSLPAAIDAADVFFVPNVPDASAGQSSMKAFDCAARGRPMVTTAWPGSSSAMLPPHSWEVDGSRAAAEAIVAAAQEPPDFAVERRAWARDQTWEARWPAWAAAVGLAPAPDDDRSTWVSQ